MNQPNKFDDLARQEESAYLDEEEFEDDVYDVPYWDEDEERTE